MPRLGTNGLDLLAPDYVYMTHNWGKPFVPSIRYRVYPVLDGKLKSAEHEVMYALVNSDPQLASKPFDERARFCYLWDRNMVEHAELLIAEASFPSTGLGIEMQIAEGKGTPPRSLATRFASG